MQTATTSPRIFPDVDNNGRVNLLDILAVVEVLSEKEGDG